MSLLHLGSRSLWWPVIIGYETLSTLQIKIIHVNQEVLTEEKSHTWSWVCSTCVQRTSTVISTDVYLLTLHSDRPERFHFPPSRTPGTERKSELIERKQERGRSPRMVTKRKLGTQERFRLPSSWPNLTPSRRVVEEEGPETSTYKPVLEQVDPVEPGCRKRTSETPYSRTDDQVFTFIPSHWNRFNDLKRLGVTRGDVTGRDFKFVLLRGLRRCYPRPCVIRDLCRKEKRWRRRKRNVGKLNLSGPKFIG